MQYTTNYNLNKPDTTDTIDIGDLNDNADAIDTALDGLQTDVDSKQDALTFDAAPTESSTNPVTSGGVYTAVSGKQDTLIFDSAPTDSSTNPVESGGVYTALADKQDAVKCGTITLSTTWSGNGPYSQEVSITGATANSKIDLQPDSTVLAQMITDGTTGLWAENDSGTITVYAYGAALTSAVTIQYTITEVTTA